MWNTFNKITTRKYINKIYKIKSVDNTFFIVNDSMEGARIYFLTFYSNPISSIEESELPEITKIDNNYLNNYLYEEVNCSMIDSAKQIYYFSLLIDEKINTQISIEDAVIDRYIINVDENTSSYNSFLKIKKTYSSDVILYDYFLKRDVPRILLEVNYGS